MIDTYSRSPCRNSLRNNNASRSATIYLLRRGITMTESGLRNTGISVVGDMPWGTHFCHFYDSKQDLLDTLVPYFKAGLDDKEFCVWIIADPLTKEEAWDALRLAV